MEKQNKSAQSSIHPSALWRVRQILQVYPVSRAKLYNDIKAGRFPKPIRLGERCVAWRASEVLAFIESLEA